MTENIISLHSDEERQLYSSILFSCVDPAFIWSPTCSEPIMLNKQAERLFMPREKGKELELNEMLPDWQKFPDNLQNSTWIVITKTNGKKKSVQIRNSTLDPIKQIYVSVILEDHNDSIYANSTAYDFCIKLDRLWSMIEENENDFTKNFISFYQFVLTELNTDSFFFIPDGIFEEFDCYQKIREINNEKLLFPEIMKDLPVRNNIQPDSLIPMTDVGIDDYQGFVYLIEINQQKLGFFVFGSLQEENRAFALQIARLLSIKCAHFLKTLNEKKERYQIDFSNKLNHLIIEGVNEGVIITDIDYRILYINSVGSMMFGFENEKVLSHHLDELLVSSEGIEGLISHGSAGSEVKYLHRRSSQIFPCRIKTECLPISAKRQYNIFIISDQTESEESRLKTEQLTQRAFLGDFASMLAHEIRNPINNMKIWVTNIKQATTEDSGIQDAIRRIEDECQRISVLADNILAFSRPIKLDLEEIDLPLLLSEILEKWKLNFARKNITYYYKRPEIFPKFVGDPRALEQVFNNLIGNSVDALDGNGGVITMKISVNDSESGRRQIVITESDNGPGIPKEKIDHVFEPFMTTKTNGNGWGLAVSKRIITTHKGTIQVKSFQGGTVFDIVLPLAEGE